MGLPKVHVEQGPRKVWPSEISQGLFALLVLEKEARNIKQPSTGKLDGKDRT